MENKSLKHSFIPDIGINIITNVTFKEDVPTTENPTADTVTIPKKEYDQLLKSKNDFFLLKIQIDKALEEWGDVFLQLQVNTKTNRLQIAAIGKNN